MNYQYCSKTSVKLFPEDYQVINAQKETCIPRSKSQNCGFTPFLTGFCRDFSYGVKDDTGNQMSLQTHPSSVKKYQLTRKKQVSI